MSKRLILTWCGSVRIKKLETFLVTITHEISETNSDFNEKQRRRRNGKFLFFKAFVLALRKLYF